jgi:hypothetical protein
MHSSDLNSSPEREQTGKDLDQCRFSKEQSEIRVFGTRFDVLTEDLRSRGDHKAEKASFQARNSG